MSYCNTCKHWIHKGDHPEKKFAFGECDNQDGEEYEPFEANSFTGVSYSDRGGNIMTGEKFGCILHEEK